MKYPKLRELAEAVKAVVKGPYTSKFPAEPHVPHKNFRGQPVYDADTCIGCLACVEACPADALAYEDILEGDGAPKRVMIHYTDSCIFCGVCEDACVRETGEKGIVMTNEWNLAYFDRSQAFETSEKELQLCEVCGAVIGTKDHMIWLAERLGEMSFSNPTLYLSRLKKLGLADDNISTVLEDDGRSDRVKILCAECRRKTSVYTDE